ncbi:ATP-binding protein [Deinococcus maricopensis]|uniref:histidine kinase n=1 Tax=Deinococcus maricopensis (strain DSM 21211 / LMG 22137 / NRRL B-23946 / LB-34) TaxID=709986 RepID=E8UB24_DEIML|nr:ATP-binding protein [Deinococcus maricopensis]ADV68263.1 GAF sensor signal transduction histidine kinase [Deinococcus maricopensis DSM 21211]
MLHPTADLNLRLQAVTEALASAQTEAAVFDVILHPAVDALGAAAGTVLLRQAGQPELHRAASAGYPALAASIWQGALVGDDGPAADALARRTPLFFEQDRALARAYPAVEARTGTTAPIAATAGLPMFLDDHPLGVLVLDFSEPHTFTAEERSFLRILAAQGAIAFGRAQLLRSLEAQVAHRTAAHAVERLRADTLALLGDALMTAATPAQVGRATLQQLGPALRASGMMMVELHGEQISAPVWWGEVPAPLAGLLTADGLPLAALPVLQHAREERVGCYLPDDALPPTLTPRLSTLAVGVEHTALPDGTPGGFLITWRPRALGAWTPGERGVLRRAAATLGLALERTHTAEALHARSLEVERQNTALEDRAQALHAANAELDAFALTVAHDLRSPVRHIINFLGLLRSTLDTTATPRSTRYLDVIEEAAERMRTLIEALLAFSRTAQQPLHLTPVDLDALVTATRVDLAPELAGRDVTWTVNALPSVMADQDLLRQVMTNLLSNAVKYTRGTPDAQIEVRAEARGAEWAVTVRDNGAGFDPAYAERLFGAFQRLHRQDEFEGTGVGLANVRRIVERHGGHVWAQGRAGEGATFGFSLPRH